MQTITLTANNITAIETLLSNLEIYQQVTITTEVGTITVQRIYHGAKAWLSSDVIPQRELGVRSMTPAEAFAHQLSLGKRYATASQVIQDEAAEELQIRAQFSVLTYAACFALSIRFHARLSQMQVTARNFDSTLFTTSTSGTINSQTIYYPADSEEMMGACDCLRYRTNGEPCEHLAFIALTELFNITTQSSYVVQIAAS